MMQLYEIGMDWLKTSNYNVNNLRIENVVIKQVVVSGAIVPTLTILFIW